MITTSHTTQDTMPTEDSKWINETFHVREEYEIFDYLLKKDSERHREP
jgi:hypothetical protein